MITVASAVAAAAADDGDNGVCDAGDRDSNDDVETESEVAPPSPASTVGGGEPGRQASFRLALRPPE